MDDFGEEEWSSDEVKVDYDNEPPRVINWLLAKFTSSLVGRFGFGLLKRVTH